jgi:hypothetical protein
LSLYIKTRRIILRADSFVFTWGGSDGRFWHKWVVLYFLAGSHQSIILVKRHATGVNAAAINVYENHNEHVSMLSHQLVIIIQEYYQNPRESIPNYINVCMKAGTLVKSGKLVEANIFLISC